ncbi:MAG: DUF4389 domain-containing protein [Kofleriaceae bacterium]
MKPYPVRYHLDPPSEFSRLQLLVRLVAFCAIGILGISFGGVFSFAYLALPILASTRIAGRDAAHYTGEDGPRIANVLRWFAAVSAWSALVADRLPTREPSETLTLELDVTTHPTPSSAMWRLLTGLPSALVLAVLGFFGTIVWLWAALTILVNRRVGPNAFWYLAGLQRWSIRLLAYQASLVDEYPPFSLGDADATPRMAPPMQGTRA